MKCNEEMEASPTRLTLERLDLAGRLMITHRIDPEYAMRALKISYADALKLVEVGHIEVPTGGELEERLLYFVNVLSRLEWRLRCDSSAIRHALDVPLQELAGQSIGTAMGGACEKLYEVRRAVDAIALPKERWWRTGHS